MSEDKLMEFLTKEFTKLNKRMDTFETKMTTIENNIKPIKSINEETANLKEFMVETKQSLENIREDNKSIYEAIGKHEISINTLKRKTS